MNGIREFCFKLWARQELGDLCCKASPYWDLKYALMQRDIGDVEALDDKQVSQMRSPIRQEGCRRAIY
eukprot:1785980-Amphidinium_carterae.1